MADFQSFRTAFRGFHRQDVVNYIEFMNQKHNSQLEQLNTQLQNAREELYRVKATPASQSDLQQQLDAALARCAELEEKLNAAALPKDHELEAYRRAERAERKAQDRAAQIYAQANAVLADATGKVEAVSGQMSAMADKISAKLESSKQELQAAVDAMYAIRPEEE